MQWPTVYRFALLLFTVLPWIGYTQDTLYIDGSQKNLNHSIADKFTIYNSTDLYSFDILQSDAIWQRMEHKKIKQSVENLDFTTDYHYIRFVLVNRTKTNLKLFLETARPITNTVRMLPIHGDSLQDKNEVISGDGIAFEKKTIPTNHSVLPIYLPAKDTINYVLTIGSDGEAVTLPMIFWEPFRFEKVERQRQFTAGLFYGIFVFVIIIYFTFFLLLRDRLFLLYTIYVAFSGLLQFALDGYVHQYIFTSGGYFTHHSVILIAGTTVFFALSYASRYLELQGRNQLIARLFLGLVAVTTVASLLPGIIFEVCYPLINLFSFLSLVFLLVVGLRVRKFNKKISPFFLAGLFSLLAGGIIFILGNVGIINTPEITKYGLKVGTLAEIIFLSILMAGKYKSLQEEKEAVQKLLLIELEEKNRIAEETNIRLEQEVVARTEQIEKQRSELAEKNRDLLDSINYAKRIQSALLPSQQKIQKYLSDFFVYFEPRDILSGDFYWMEEVQTSDKESQRLLLYATADCTGHGVPGAFVSVVCNNLLKLSKTQRDVNTTGEALDFIDQEINTLLNPEFKEQEIRDGMDIALCAINLDAKKLYYSGAKIPLYIVRKGELIVYKGDRHAIGNDTKDINFHFQTHAIDLQSGDLIYTFSDGIPDQFGGEQGKKFLTKRLKELLLANASLPMEAQKEKLTAAIREWIGKEQQIDDMILIGVRIP